jgi:fructokinase
MRDIVCFGEALIDFLAQPPAPGDAPPTFAQFAGGAPANVAAAVAKLGGAAAFVGMLSTDLFGDFLHDSLRSAGVKTDYIVRTDRANTGLAFVALDAHGERRFSFYRPPAADLLFRPEHFQPACFAAAAILHACSNSLTDEVVAQTTLEGMRRARAAGALVSFDLNWRAGLWDPRIDPRARLWAALREADLVKLCGAELALLAQPLGGEQALLDQLWRGRTALVVITDGAAPIRYYGRAHRASAPTFEVTARDTNAAGDAFIGGLLFWLAEHNIGSTALDALVADPDRIGAALRFAAACGAIAVTRHGAFAALPTMAEVRSFLRERA